MNAEKASNIPNFMTLFYVLVFLLLHLHTHLVSDSSEDERQDAPQNARQADVSAGRPEPPSLEPPESQSFFSSAIGFFQDLGGRGPTPP